MRIENLSMTDLQELSSLLHADRSCSCNQKSEAASLDNFGIGKTVIIRTYSAGVWCGILARKAGNEVILKNARRMWFWWCKKSISLSGVAVHGIKQEKSKIASAVPEVWLEAIEIIPIEGDAAKSIMEAPDAEAE